jgi:hypothetical protein
MLKFLVGKMGKLSFLGGGKNLSKKNFPERKILEKNANFFGKTQNFVKMDFFLYFS